MALTSYSAWEPQMQWSPLYERDIIKSTSHVTPLLLLLRRLLHTSIMMERSCNLHESSPSIRSRCWESKNKNWKTRSPLGGRKLNLCQRNDAFPTTQIKPGRQLQKSRLPESRPEHREWECIGKSDHQRTVDRHGWQEVNKFNSLPPFRFPLTSGTSDNGPSGIDKRAHCTTPPRSPIRTNQYSRTQGLDEQNERSSGWCVVGRNA